MAYGQNQYGGNTQGGPQYQEPDPWAYSSGGGSGYAYIPPATVEHAKQVNRQNAGVGQPQPQQEKEEDPFPYTLDISQHQMDPRYLEKMRGIAFDDPGQSPWLKYQMEQDRLRQADDREMLSSRGASDLATQQGQMAMRGGLTSGATERLGSQNLMGQLMGQQQLSRAAAGREGAYRQAAEERQRNVLTQLPSVEQSYASYGADLDKYNIDQMNEAEAAKREAAAIRRSGGGGGGLFG